MTDNDGRVTWVLVDGENIDATLGASILGRRPQPDERPRWDRLIAFAQRAWGQSARGVFFLNASSGIPTTFVQALKAMDFVVVPLAGVAGREGRRHRDPADAAGARRAAGRRHAGQPRRRFPRGPRPSLDRRRPPGRHRGVHGVPQRRASRRSPVVERFDLEYDARVFDAPLPRIRVIPIDEFDPATFLG